MKNTEINQRSEKKYRFIEKTLTDLHQTMEQSVYAEQTARLDGLLQHLNPRIKIVAVLSLIFAVNLSHRFPVLIALFLFSIALTLASKISIMAMIKRVWLVVLVFTGLVALPSVFITPGPVLFHLPLGMTVSRTGLLSSAFLMIRVVTSVTYAFLLVLTTPWNSLLKTLGDFHLPDVILLTIGMTYRYIHLLLQTTSDMFLSRKSRMIGKMSGADERKIMINASGALLGKSLEISGEVALAMESRGYRGIPRTMERAEFSRADWAAVICSCLITVSAIWLGR
jgi:cobalt ECF transporter T component CbiQ